MTSLNETTTKSSDAVDIASSAAGTSPVEAFQSNGGSSSVSVETIAFILLGVAAAAPIILILTVAIVLRCRKMRQHRRHATEYRDAVARDAWKAAPESDKTATADGQNGLVRRPDIGVKGSPDGRDPVKSSPGVLTELDVRDFFNVRTPPSFGNNSAIDGGGRSRTPSPGQLSVIKDGSYVMAGTSTPYSQLTARSGSSSSSFGDGPVDTRRDTIALMERCRKDGDNQHPTRMLTTEKPVQRHTTKLHEPPLAYIETAEKPLHGESTMHTVRAEVERQPRGLDDDDRISKSQSTNSPEGSSHPVNRLRRSDACYAIAGISDPPLGNEDQSDSHDLPASSKTPTVASSDGDSNATVLPVDSLQEEAADREQFREDSDVRGNDEQTLSTEEEQVLRSLDAVVDDYDDLDLEYTPRTSTDPKITHL